VIELYPDVVADIMKIVEEAREDLGDDLTGHKGKNRRPPGMVEK
jgi:arylsulfatase